MHTIDTATEITTAARRIQRDLRTRSQIARTWYTADGQMVISHEADMYDTTPGAYDGAACSFTGGRHTLRDIQDHLDAHAYAIEMGGDYQAERGFYLLELEDARDAERSLLA